jgi:SAM-dependent methyltransferase
VSQPYLSLEAELHDLFWAAEDDGSELRLMAGFLDQHPGRALEIGCGSGRLLLPLLGLGYEVEGLELSGDMLNLCRTRAAEAGLEPVLHAGDMSTWAGKAGFSSLLAPAFTLQLAEDPLATLRHWHGLLGPCGALYLTVFLPFAELDDDLPEGRWYEDHHAVLPDGTTALLETRHRLDRTASRLLREHRYTVASRPPRRYRSTQSLRWFTPAQMRGLLAEAGFEVLDLFADFEPGLRPLDPHLRDFDGIFTCHAVKL